MSRFVTTLAAAAVAVATPALASAAVISIDTFATPVGQHGLHTPGALAAVQNAPGVLGGRRELDITRNTGTAPAFDKVTVTQFSVAGDSFLDFDQTSGAEGSLELTYDGNSGNLNADFSGNRKVLVNFTHFNAGEELAMGVTIAFFDGLNAAFLTSPVFAAGAQTQQFDFTTPDFDAIDFSSINRVSVFFDAPRGGDFRVTSIIAREAFPVPEPAGAGLALLGATAMLAARRRS